jgi:hypothetical protein
MKKQEKLQLKKVTLRDLDECQLDTAVGGATGMICLTTHPPRTCVVCLANPR